MKVRTQFGITGYKGKADGMVYYYLPHCLLTVARRLPQEFTESEQHNDYRLIAKNLKKINPTQAYRDDFKVYTALYKQLPEAESTVSSWYNLYIRMMWDIQRAGLADLKTLTRAQIIANNLPCISVTAAVEAGLLPPVTNWESLNHGI